MFLPQIEWYDLYGTISMGEHDVDKRHNLINHSTCMTTLTGITAPYVPTQTWLPLFTGVLAYSSNGNGHYSFIDLFSVHLAVCDGVWIEQISFFEMVKVFLYIFEALQWSKELQFKTIAVKIPHYFYHIHNYFIYNDQYFRECYRTEYHNRLFRLPIIVGIYQYRNAQLCINNVA